MPRVLIAGIAGASLGTEIAKSLKQCEDYEIFGCDISPLAFGHYDHNFLHTFLIERDEYITNLLALCVREGIDCLIPGGDQPAILIGRESDRFVAAGIVVCQNSPELVARLSHKGECFKLLAEIGVDVPQTYVIESEDQIANIRTPCIVKPALYSGGSAYVFFARDADEVRVYCFYLKSNGLIPVVQEYIPVDGGEFTVGVLSLPNRACAGAIALKRSFESKLSISMRGEGFLISSGYSQGWIDAYPEICEVAIDIANRLGSSGPLNIQGRVTSDGRFMPFEINPRFSASTFLRTLAGFNEVDYFVRHAMGLPQKSSLSRRRGWYLRTLSETFIPPDGVRG